MERSSRLPFLLDVWREVSRHLEITESLRDLWPLVAAEVATEAIWIRRWFPERARLDTLGHAGFLGDDLPARSGAKPAEVPELRRWAAARSPSRFPATRGGLARLLAPEGLAGPFVAGPLFDGDELTGVLVLTGDAGGHLGVVRALLEPFAAALRNDHRLHELAVLKEAAEADKRALLTKLQRQDINEPIVGAGDGLREVMARVDQVARTDAPVLLLGETGSGKEVVARAIHTRSGRSSAPFLRVNCGAIPTELVDSELFGHEKGAFTGAMATRKGWFERADGGTLFLDEIGELPAAAQVRLLRVLQDGTFQRVGGVDTLAVDVRIVAATHRDLHQLVREGRFRQDLWYRIHVFPIDLPPLRARPADIPTLVRHFAERAGLRLFGRPLVPTEEHLQMLGSYPWPGNVRELAAVIERAAILGDGRGLAVQAALGVIPTSPVMMSASDDQSRERVEDALRRCLGRIEGPFGAAAALGVNPHTLRARMRRMGIEWSRFRGGVPA